MNVLFLPFSKWLHRCGSHPSCVDLPIINDSDLRYHNKANLIKLHFFIGIGSRSSKLVSVLQRRWLKVSRLWWLLLALCNLLFDSQRQQEGEVPPTKPPLCCHHRRVIQLHRYVCFVSDQVWAVAFQLVKPGEWCLWMCHGWESSFHRLCLVPISQLSPSSHTLCRKTLIKSTRCKNHRWMMLSGCGPRLQAEAFTRVS